jgi:septum formation protein
MAIILASASPRRVELLANAGISCIVRPTNIAELQNPGEEPRPFAERMAREKALAAELKSARDYILAADTVVVVDGQVVGKPGNAADAARMLRMLSARTHDVITGVCLRGEGFADVRSESTRVQFLELSDAEIGGYVASGESMDKAGAYGIQGLASKWIPTIEGDYFNVVGLPVSLVWRMLREHGVL